MLKLSVFELFARLIPEVLVFIFAAYVFTKTKIEGKQFIISSVLLGICVFTIRMLPINYGVHTILNIIMLTIIACTVIKADIIEGIKSSLLTAIILFALEGINIMILRMLVGENLENIISNPVTKTLCTLPSLIGLLVVVWIYYKQLKRRKKLKDD